MAEYVMIKDLADSLEMDRSYARKYITRNGINPVKQRSPGNGGQLCLAVTTEQAKQIRRLRAEQGYTRKEQAVRPIDGEDGFFYAIRVVPDLDPGRIKLGFANNVRQRLMQHRTSAPTADVLKTWPCKRTWERAVMDALSRYGRQIRNEVFQIEDEAAMIECGDRLFELLR